SSSPHTLRCHRLVRPAGCCGVCRVRLADAYGGPPEGDEEPAHFLSRPGSSLPLRPPPELRRCDHSDDGRRRHTLRASLEIVPESRGTALCPASLYKANPLGPAIAEIRRSAYGANTLRHDKHRCRL